MKKTTIDLIITDLDDTIWDWLKMWYNSFQPFISSISEKCNIDIALLKNDFKKLHQKFGTTEVSFAYQNLKSLNNKHLKIIETKSAQNGKSIIHEYYSNKKKNLILYKDVLQTLTELKKVGVKLIGFTESNSFYTKYRIKHLSFDGIFDAIFCPEDHGLPSKVRRYYQNGFWEPNITKFHYLPRGTKKPNPKILLQIVNSVAADIKKTIYIGDKLNKDILMANDASITSVYAQYGDKIDSNAYALLREVTHWPEKDVQKEAAVKQDYKNIDVQPMFILKKSFKELFKYFEFNSFWPQINQVDKDAIIKIWDKVISVQQHFNDIEIKIRNFALTIFTFVITGIGFIFKSEIKPLFFNVSPALTLAIVGIILIFALFFMDRFWYHNLLYGAVNQGLFIESRWKKLIPEMTLSENIKLASPTKFWRIKINSKTKLLIFYSLLLLTLIIISISLHTTPHNNDSKHQQTTQIDGAKTK